MINHWSRTPLPDGSTRYQCCYCEHERIAPPGSHLMTHKIWSKSVQIHAKNTHNEAHDPYPLPLNRWVGRVRAK